MCNSHAKNTHTKNSIPKVVAWVKNKHGKAKQEVIHTNPTPSKQITHLNRDKFMQSKTNTRSQTPLPLVIQTSAQITIQSSFCLTR